MGEIISTLGTTGEVAGGYNLNFNGHDLAVSADTTLNELIDMIYDNGGTAVLDNTGRLSINGGTLTGSVADALGIVSTTHTSSVSASGDTIYTTKEEYAELDTTFADIGINNSSYIIHDNLGNAITTINVTGTDTIGSFFDDLKANGIDATLSNGVISLESADGRYITGALANALGLDIQTVTEVVNTSQSSTLSVTHTDTVLADITSTLGDIGAITGSGQNILIYDENQTVIGTISTLTTSSTVGDMIDALKEWGINASITNGVISFYSETGRYAAGTIMDNLGVTVESGMNKTITIAETVTSSGQISYTQNVVATEDTLISDVITLPADSNIIINNSEGNAIGTILVDNTTTFGDLFAQMAEYGIDGDIHNGSVKLSPDDGQYATGAVLDLMGITLNQVVVTTTVGMTNSSSEVISYTNGVKATEDTLISDVIANFDSLGYVNGIYTADDNVIDFVTVTSTMTFGEFFAEFSKYGIDADIHDGVIKFSFDNGGYVAGDVIDALGMTATETVVTKTVGMEMTSDSAVTYNKTITATGSSKLSEFADQLPGGLLIEDTHGTGLGFVEINENTTFNELFAGLGALGINAWFSEEGTITVQGAPGLSVTECADDGTITNTHYFDTYFGLNFDNMQTVTVTTTSGMTATSGTLNMTVERAATEDDLILDFISSWNGASDILIMNSDGTQVSGGILQPNIGWTFRDLLDGLAFWGIDASMQDGVITLSSDTGRYIAGYTATTLLGIGTQTTIVTTTMGLQMASSSAITYTETVYATADSVIADFAGGEPFPDLTINGEYFLTNANMTFNEFFSLLASYGIRANFAYPGQIEIAGPAITIDDQGYFNKHFGLDFNRMQTRTIGFSSSSGSITYTKQVQATLDSSFDDILDSVGSVFSLTLRNTKTGDTVTEGLESWGSLGDYFASCLMPYNILGTISDGIIQLQCIGDYEILNPSALNLTKDTIVKTVTIAADFSSSSPVVGLSSDTRLNSFGMANDNVQMRVYSAADKQMYNLTIAKSTTVGDLLGILGSYGIHAYIDDTERVVFQGGSESYIASFDGELAMALKIDSSTLYTTYNKNCAIYHSTPFYEKVRTTTLTYDTTLGELESATQHGIWIDNGETGENATLLFYDSTSIRDMLTQLAAYGITGSINASGQLTISSNSGWYITDNLYMGRLFSSSTGSNPGLSKVSYVTGNYMQDASNVISVTNTVTATYDTTFGELGIGNTYYNVMKEGQIYTFSTAQDQTLGDFIATLAGAGIGGYLSNGTLTLTPTQDETYIAFLGGNLSSVLHIQAGLGYSYNRVNETIISNTTSSRFVGNETVNLDTSATLGERGLTSNGTINVTYNGENYTITVNATNTIDDVLTALGGLGISGSMLNGRITLRGTDTGYITAMSSNLQSALGITAGLGNTYQTVRETQTYISDTSDTIRKTITQTMTTATTLDELIGDSDTIRVVSNGQLYVLDFDKTSTIDDILTTLAGFGIAGYVQDGRITLIGSENAYILNIGPGDLESKLDISYGEGNSYITSTETIFSNTTSDELEQDVVTTLNTSSTFADLGLSGTGTINVTYNGNDYTITVTSDKTVDDILTTLAGLGISGSVEGGRLTLRGTDDGYITAMSANVQDALKITAGANNTYTTSTDTIYENSTSNNMSYDDVRTMSTSTTLGELGLSADQYITVVSNGTQHIVTVTSEMTVDDIISTLAGYGIAGSVIDGRISFTGGIDTYIHDMSQALKDTLRLTLGNGNSWTTEVGQTWVNSDSDEQTEVKDDVLITGDTILSSINGYNNGDGRLVVHQTNGQFVTITVDGSSTVDEFFEQISQYGLVGTIGKDGKVTITGVGNVYLQAASGGTNILTALNLSNVVTNVQTITSNRTSDTLTHTVTVAASGTTTLGNLADSAGNDITFDASGNVSLVLETTSDAGNQHITLTFSRTQSLYDVIDALAQYGIQASIDAAGRFSVTSSNLTDFDISGELGEFLMGNYTKEYGEDTTYNVSTNLVQETVVYMNDASRLTDFGITGGNILVTQQGVNYTINIDPTTIQTIGDFRNLLAQYGFNSIIDSSGRLSVSGVGESYLSTITGGSNILDILGLTDWTLGEVTQSSAHLTDADIVVNTISMSDRIADLTDAAGNNLGITDGQIYVYQDGTRSTINIDTNDTLETLAAKLSQYGITVGISQEGRLYFDGNNDSYLTTNGLSSANASNILSKLNIEGNWSTRYDSTSGKLTYEEEVVNVVDRSTKLTDLKDAAGNDLNITEGTYYVYSNGVRNTETITADTTVNDFMATLAKYGLIADIAEDGSISVGAYNNTYLATSALAGQNSNVVSTLFAEWDFVNIYTSNGLDIPTDEIRAINRDTKLADINEGTYQAGYITVVKDGVQTNIELKADDTVGTLMDELALYGFESVINEDGQLIIKNSGDSLLQNYTGSGQASNALTLLGIGVNDWISTNTYKSGTLSVVQTSTLDASATRDTLLSELGVSTGEYYVYNNGVRYTALISSDETLGSFMDTLKSFGLETSLVQGPDGAVLSVVGKGNSYIAKSTSTTNASNVVDILFTNGVEETNEYSGLQQTSELVTTFSDATLDTLLSYYDTPWGTGMLTAEGDLSVTVNGVDSVIKITADETFGSLIEKFNALGLEATLANGELMIQSGYDTFTINTAGTTSSLLATIGLTYHNDLGGYVASTDTVRSTTTSIEERTVSVSNYADMSTRLGTLNISDGSLTVYRNGERATVQIQANDTFADLQSRLSAAFSDLRLEFQDGYLTFYSADGNSVEVGATTDTSNFAAITGITNEGTGTVRSARELYCVNTDSVITSSGLFRKGTVTEGTFVVGNATFNITNTTTLANLISQINSSDEANATAYWDNIDGKLVIKSRTTGSAFVNIEAGTSNFTDIMGYTSSEWAADGSLDVTRMNIATQEVGQNARVQINGTTYTSTSNTITSDVSRIKGLTINLKGLTEGTAVTLTVERDKETLANAISDVVDSYNELMQNVDEAIAIDGSLHGETTLKLIRNQLRNMMTSSDAGTTIFRNLDSIGISVSDASGSNISTTNDAIVNLTFDKDKFIDAFEADQDAVKELLIGGANNTGIFTKVETLLESSLQSVTGYFSSADSAYQREINRLDEKIAKANDDIERYRARLEAKFSAMDMLIAQMQQQYSTFLTT